MTFDTMLLVLGKVSHVVCLVLTVVEMAWTELDKNGVLARMSGNTTENSPLDRTYANIIQLAGVQTYSTVSYVIKYTAVVVLALATYQLAQHRHEKTIRGQLRSKAIFLAINITGVTALFCRLLLVFYYLVTRLCTNKETILLEPHHILLGIATGAGIITCILFIIHIAWSMYSSFSNYRCSHCNALIENKATRKCEDYNFYYITVY